MKGALGLEYMALLYMLETNVFPELVFQIVEDLFDRMISRWTGRDWITLVF